jgi:hypothetical protein
MLIILITRLRIARVDCFLPDFLLELGFSDRPLAVSRTDTDGKMKAL